MLCSHCSQPLKPVVAIDIDGTLGEFHDHFHRFAFKYLGMPYVNLVDEFDGSQFYKTWFCERMQIHERDWRDIKLAYRQGAQKRSMPIFSWSRYLTHNLRTFTELWLTTTRPYLRLDGVDPDTRFWLQHNGIDYDYLLYDEDKYDQLADRVDHRRVIAIMDDLPELLARAEVLFGANVPILMQRPHNRVVWDVYSDDQKTKDGLNALRLIARRAEHWRTTAASGSNGGSSGIRTGEL